MVKKYLLLLFAFFSSLAPMLAQLAFAPEIGISTCSMKIVAPTPFHTVSSGSIIGEKIGGLLDIGITEHLYFQSGLFFSVKGNTKSLAFNSGDSAVENIDQSFRINYLEVPINVVFKTSTQGFNRIFFGLGASIA